MRKKGEDSGQCCSSYTAVLVVEVDDESERPPSHRLSGDEGVLEGGLSAGRNHGAQLQSGEVLDVELVILIETNRTKLGLCGKALRLVLFVEADRYLWVTERSIQRLHDEVL